MSVYNDERKIVTVKICELEGDITIANIQKRIDEVKQKNPYLWIKFYINIDRFVFFSNCIFLYGEHYQTAEQVAKDKRRELFKELKAEFEQDEI